MQTIDHKLVASPIRVSSRHESDCEELAEDTAHPTLCSAPGYRGRSQMSEPWLRFYEAVSLLFTLAWFELGVLAEP